MYGVENSVDDGIEKREKFGRKKNVSHTKCGEWENGYDGGKQRE